MTPITSLADMRIYRKRRLCTLNFKVRRRFLAGIFVKMQLSVYYNKEIHGNMTKAAAVFGLIAVAVWPNLRARAA